MKLMLLSLSVAFSFRIFYPSLQGVEVNAVEVVCQSDTGGSITSGGGFSPYSDQPSWQSAALTRDIMPATTGVDADVPAW